MISSLLISLPNNIFAKINFLKQDFVGFNPDLSPIINFILGILLAFDLILVSFLIGNKIRNKLFKNFNDSSISPLIDIGLGYLLIGSLVGLLGILSILNNEVILVFVILAISFTFYPLKSISKLKNLLSYINESIKDLKKNKIVFLTVTIFVIVAIINLINPEVREDQYHVDFPKLYLREQTIMIPPKEPFHVSASPMLGEMSYVMGIFFWSEETARYIHFSFYLLVVLLLLQFSKLKNLKYSVFTPLLFVSAPVVIHEASSMYTDFQWIFYFLLAIYILIANLNFNKKIVFLCGILIGGMLSCKLWTIAFIPALVLFLIYKLRHLKQHDIYKFVFAFLLGILLVSGIWILRSYLLTGLPFYPALSGPKNLENISENFSIWHYISINTILFNPLNFINVFSPLFFFGLFVFLYKFKKNIKSLRKTSVFIILLILFFEYALINYPYGRYLLGLYVIFIFASSFGLSEFVAKFKLGNFLIKVSVFVLFIYYFLNSILVLPYSFGVADKNKYLSRILIRDNSSYYNYGNRFDKYIKKNDYVATYGVFGYFFANFRFIDVNFILSTDKRDFDLFKNNKVTKLFIKGGDINYFCKKISINNCDNSKYELISRYDAFPTFYLYKIK